MHTEVSFVSLDRPDVSVWPGGSHGQDIGCHVEESFDIILQTG